MDTQTTDAQVASRPTRRVCWALAVDNFGSGLLLPLLGLLLAFQLDLGWSVAGAVLAIGAASAMVAPLVSNRLQTSYGPGAQVLGSLVMQAVGALLVAIPQRGPAVVGCVVLAVGFSFFACNSSAFVLDALGDHNPDHTFAVVTAFRAGGFAAGNGVAGTFIAVLGTSHLTWLALADAVTFVIAFGLLRQVAIGVRSESGASGGMSVPLREVLAHKRFLRVFALTFLGAIAADFATVSAVPYAAHLDPDHPWIGSYLITFLTLGSALVSVAVVRAATGYTRTGGLLLANALMMAWALVMLGASYLSSAPVMLTALFSSWLLLLAGLKLFYPLSSALAATVAPTERRGAYMALYQYAYSVAIMVAPALLGLFDLWRGLPWLIVVTALLGASVLTLRLRPHLGEPENRIPPLPDKQV